MKLDLQKELDQLKALNENVIIMVVAESHGTEEKSETGILLGIRREGVMPEYGKIVKIGENVPKDFLNKLTPLPPTQAVRHVPWPKVIFENAQSTKIDEKLVTCNYKAIQVLYEEP